MASKTGTATGNNGNWTNAADAYADGGGVATLTQATRNKWHIFNGFTWSGGNLPSRAVIDGIEVSNDIFVAPGCGGWGFLDVQIRKDVFDSWSSIKSSGFPTTETTLTVGSSTDTWGKGFTVTQMNNTFEVMTTARTCIVYSEQVYRKRMNNNDPLDYEGCWHVSMLKVGNVILGYDFGKKENSWGEVTEISEDEATSYLRIAVVDDTGDFGLSVTDTHPLWTKKGWVLAGDLKVGDKVFSREDNKWHKITKIFLREETVPVYTISTTLGNFYVNGVLVKNKPRKACQFGVSFNWRNDYIRPIVYYHEATQSWRRTVWTPILLITSTVIIGFTKFLVGKGLSSLAKKLYLSHPKHHVKRGVPNGSRA